MSNSYDPKNFYAQTTSPGQFGSPPNQLIPTPTRPYSHGTLSILFLCCLVAIICVFIPGAVHNIGISLIIGLLVSVAILDWKGFTTLNGLIKWQQMGRSKRWLLGCAFFILCPLSLLIYVFSNAIKSTDGKKKYQPELPSPKRRPKVGCATGIVVALLCIPFTFAAADWQRAGTRLCPYGSAKWKVLLEIFVVWPFLLVEVIIK